MPNEEQLTSIVSAEGVCGGVACFKGTRIPVWVVVRLRQLGADDTEILLSYPSIKAHELAQAWIYAERYREAVEQLILNNQG